MFINNYNSKQVGGGLRTNKPNEYRPDRIAKYAVADNHIWGSRSPLRTSDQARLSASAGIALLHVNIQETHGKDRVAPLLYVGVFKSYPLTSIAAFRFG